MEKPGPQWATMVASMLRTMRHRGPDGCGMYAQGEVVHAASADELAARTPPGAAKARVIIAQSRLAITGDDGVLQPFESPDHRLALTHNGEAYNHLELASLIGNAGSVASGCDTEALARVLESHYAATKGDLTEAMRRTVRIASGMYALAATDGAALVLARDAIGKKPIYYVDGEGVFAYASERKALVEIARLSGGFIERLPPGQLLTVRPGELARVEVCERLAPPALDIAEMEQAVAEYGAALDRSIRRRTRGVKRAAVWFSGGVDSVLVARLLQQAGVEVTGYVAGVEGSGDVRTAIEVAGQMNLPIKVTHVHEEMLGEWLPRILEAIELNGPVMAETSIPMWFSAKAAHEDGHRIVFSGQAADELFGGYPWYRKVVGEHGPLTLHARMWEDLLALPLDTLEREDRVSMAWSLELRAPFLDADVIRAAMRILPTLKVAGPDDPQQKLPHRLLAARRGVPESVAYRAKAMAQDGANVHELLASLAQQRFPDGAPGVEVADFGSNYRYRDTPESYTTPEVRALLASIVEEGGFVVAQADGSAVVPRPRAAREAASPAGPAAPLADSGGA